MEITTAFNILLWIGAAFSFVGFGLVPSDQSNLYLAIVIIIIILVTGTFSYYQNNQSEKVMNSFKNLTVEKVNVVREGKSKIIDAVDIVQGDLIKIKCGDKIPADLRIVEAVDLEVDNSPLTVINIFFI